MKRTFTYFRNSPVNVKLTVMSNGYVILVAPRSLEETLEECKDKILSFLIEAMQYYNLGVAECNNRKPKKYISTIHMGRYYSIDKMFYRCDLPMRNPWRAPASDLLRILLSLPNENQEYNNIKFIPGLE